MKTTRHISKDVPSARFVDAHFVNETYHYKHSQLMHKHDDVLELLYVQKGKGRYTVGSREYALQPGNLVICNAGTLHGEGPFQKEVMQSYCCVLDSLSLPGLPENCLIEAHRHPVLFFSPGSALEQMMLVLHQLRQSEPENRAACNHLANAVLALVFQHMQTQSKEESVEPGTEDLIREVSKYLDENFAQPITLEELGAVFHMSHFYLSHIFKKETGISPMKYVAHRKIGEAQCLLMKTAIPIQQIGEQLGFSSSCHLSAMFKKYVGLTPSEYRRHFRS